MNAKTPSQARQTRPAAKGEKRDKEDSGNMKTMTTAALTENLSAVLDFVNDFTEEIGAPMKAQMQTQLAVEEIFVNIAHYAYGDGAGDAEISVDFADGELSVTFRDAGVPYDPLKKADPDVTLSAEERQIGGLGIFLVKKNMDSVEYAYEDGRNVFTMKKKI